ncbi:MAG: hypothetical protein SWE60_02125 [Thermodesulfobacteriota bacterium]|nr:hypothetical protein [Thermodesulfobacteriota bacterium]
MGFIAQTPDGQFEKYQITQTLHKDNLDRKLSPFALHDTHLKEGKNILLTLDDVEGEVAYQDTRVLKRNIIRWILGI